MKSLILVSVAITVAVAQRGEGPQCIQNFYDKMLNNPRRFGQNLTFIQENFHEDWNTRPNPLKPTGRGPSSGPFPEGLKQIMEMKDKMIPDINFDRQHTLMCSNDKFNGDKVVVMSKFDATLHDVPENSEYNEYAFFPGIPSENIRDRFFETMAIDIHNIKDGKIKRSWHVEDWSSAAQQVLRETPAPNFRNPRIKPGRSLIEVPKCIYNFYDEVFRNPTGAQYNKTLLEKTVHKDWNTRPNWLNPMGTDGPGREGLKKHLGLMTQMIRNVKVERKHMFLCGDRVVVLSKMSGEIGDVPSGFDEFPCFPGINPDKIRGKYFETMGIDVHVVTGGLIKQSWHVEDVKCLLDQVLHDKPVPDFGFDEEYYDF
jgi:hypothetical protein